MKYDKELVDLVNNNRAFMCIDFTGDFSGMVYDMSNHAGVELFNSYQFSAKTPLQPQPVFVVEPDNDNPWNSQVGGSHYTDKAIQPLQRTLLNKGYEAFSGACYTKIDKYTTRVKDNEVEQLKKARHVLDLWIYEAEQHSKGE